MVALLKEGEDKGTNGEVIICEADGGGGSFLDCGDGGFDLAVDAELFWAKRGNQVTVDVSQTWVIDVDGEDAKVAHFFDEDGVEDKTPAQEDLVRQ